MSSPPENWRAVRMFLVGSLVPGSTQAVDFIDHGLQVQASRAESARRSAAMREERLRDQIIAAADDPLPALHPMHSAWASATWNRIDHDPKRYGFKKAPDIDTVRKAGAWNLQRYPQLAAISVPTSVARST